jgi:hypothetical protein
MRTKRTRICYRSIFIARRPFIHLLTAGPLRLVSAVRMGDTMSATFPSAAVGTRCVASGAGRRTFEHKRYVLDTLQHVVISPPMA